MPWPLKEPIPLLDAVLAQRVGRYDSVRHAALRLHARSVAKPISAAFECRTARGTLVYVKAPRPLHELLSATLLAEVADAQAHGRGTRTTFGPKIKVKHRPDAVRKRNPAAGKMKVVVVTGGPIMALPIGCPCQLYVEGAQLAPTKPAADAPASETNPEPTAEQVAPNDPRTGYDWPEIERIDAEEYWTHHAKHGKAPTWNERANAIHERFKPSPSGDYLRTSGRINLIPKKPPPQS